jgi:hypothetical protein
MAKQIQDLDVQSLDVRHRWQRSRHERQVGSSFRFRGKAHIPFFKFGRPTGALGGCGWTCVGWRLGTTVEYFFVLFPSIRLCRFDHFEKSSSDSLTGTDLE